MFINCYTNKNINEAIEFGSFDNMRKMEINKTFKDKRMQARDKNNVNTFKTRKGRVGSYKEELSSKEIKFINEEVRSLAPELGYGFAN